MRLFPTGDEHSNTRHRLPAQLIVLHDDDLAWFARNGLPVTARNVLDDETKTSNNLWYEESLPPDTLLYAVIAERVAGMLEKLSPLLNQHRYLQAGGNETVGMGWLTLHPVEVAQ
jgi:CRISPR-associated protein Cmr4